MWWHSAKIILAQVWDDCIAYRAFDTCEWCDHCKSVPMKTSYPASTCACRSLLVCFVSAHCLVPDRGKASALYHVVGVSYAWLPAEHQWTSGAVGFVTQWKRSKSSVKKERSRILFFIPPDSWLPTPFICLEPVLMFILSQGWTHSLKWKISTWQEERKKWLFASLLLNWILPCNQDSQQCLQGVMCARPFPAAFGYLWVHTAALGEQQRGVLRYLGVCCWQYCKWYLRKLIIGVRPNKAVTDHTCVHHSGCKCPIPEGATYG